MGGGDGGSSETPELEYNFWNRTKYETCALLYSIIHLNRMEFPHQLDQSILVLRVVRLYFSFLLKFIYM